MEWYREGKNGVEKDKQQAYFWLVQSHKKKADDGDNDSTYILGQAYMLAKLGLGKNVKEAYQWFKKGADRRDARSMSCASWFLFNGTGVTKNAVYGMMLLSTAASMGSDSASYRIGKFFLDGSLGMPKDHQQAKYWLTRAVDGSCTIKHADEKILREARRALARIEDAGSG